jgi:hypothetical protein
VTDAAGRCSCCGATSGPFAKVEGLFPVLICLPWRSARPDRTAASAGTTGPYPVMTRASSPIARPRIPRSMSV